MYFCLRFRHHFFRHTKFDDWLVFGEIFLLLKESWKKCVGCFLVHLFFFFFFGGGGGGGVIKKRGMRDILRKHINNIFYCVLMVKKGICKKGPPIYCNTHYLLRLRAKFQTAIVSCLRFIWIANFSDHRRVWYQIWKIILLLKYIL